jgi:hypothetical protein
MLRTLTTALAIGVFTAACSSTPEVQTGADAETIMEGALHKVDHSRTDLAYVDPEANFGKYQRVMITPLGVDKVEIIQPTRTTSVINNRDWELTAEDKEKLRSAYMEAMRRELSEKGGYDVVETAGNDVLQISAVLTSLAPTAAKDDNVSRPIGRSRVYTEGSGSMSIAVAFGDSDTGEVLGLIKDRKRNDSYWSVNNSVTNLADVKRMFSSWAAQIRKGLDRVHGKQ